MIDIGRLRPELRFLVDMPGMPFDLASVEAARKNMVGFPVENPERVRFWDEWFERDGARVRVRLVCSASSDASGARDSGNLTPGLCWFHGGGMAIGSPEADDGLLARFAEQLGIVCASVDYRLTPEHPYPIPFEDAYAGLCWFAEQAGRLGVDTSRIAVGGASAGGCLCAAVAIASRDLGGPDLAFQMPLFPMLDDTMDTPSNREVTAELIPFSWNSDMSAVAWDWYLAGLKGGEVPYYAAPARCPNLSGLPPAYTLVGQFDPLRDETISYVQRLAQAGVPTEFHLYDGAVHGFELAALGTATGDAVHEGIISALARGVGI